MMNSKQLKGGIILSYVTQLANILIGVLYTPIMLRLLGQSEYGLYQLVFSVVSYLSILSLGFGSSYMRFYSRYKAKEDEENIAKLNGMFLIIFMVISVICILCGIAMLINIEAIFGKGLTSSELDTARILLALMVVNIAATFVKTVFANSITAHERFIFQRVVELLRVIFNPFLALPLLIMGYGSVAMVSVTTFLTFFVLFLDIYYCVKKIKIRFSFRKLDFSLLKEMWVFTAFIFMAIITDQLNWNIDKFLLGRMIGTVAVAVYGVAGQLHSLYMSLSSSVSSVFIPRVNMLIAKKEDDKALTDLFTRVGRVQLLILGLVISGYIVYGREFIKIWAGKGYEESYIIGLLLMLSVTVSLIQNLGIEVRRAKNLHKIPAVVMLATAVSNLVLSVFLIKLYGVIGAALGTFIVKLMNTIYMNVYYQKRCGLNIVSFWARVLPLMFPIALTGVIGIGIKQFIYAGSVEKLIFSMLIYTIIYCLIVGVLGMNEEEKQFVKHFLRRRGKDDRNS